MKTIYRTPTYLIRTNGHGYESKYKDYPIQYFLTLEAVLYSIGLRIEDMQTRKE